MIAARKLLSDKAKDIDNLIRGLLLGAGLKLAALRRRTFEERVRSLAGKHPFASELVLSLLTARGALLREKAAIDVKLKSIADSDPVCRRLMTAPGIGEITALTYRSAIDEPRRFAKSRSLGVHFGMTPKIEQSGDVTTRGRITGWGDGRVRQALVIAAWQLFRRSGRDSWLKAWANQLAQRRGTGRAMIAAARRLAIILHRMWVSETDFRWEAAVP
jgi:transposase